MSTGTLAGNRCTAVRVHVPAWGLPFADVSLDSEATLAGRVELTLADLAFSGTILSGGPWLGRSSYRVVAGAGGWGKELRAKGYAADQGVKRSTVLEDAARECGETIEGVPAGAIGPAYDRLAGCASDALHILSPRAWYVGTDGVTRLGRRTRVTYAGKAARGPVDLAAGSVELMADAIADIVPGVVVDGVEAVDVVHTLEGSKLRTTIWGSGLSTTSKRLAAWAALLDRLRPLDRYRGTWEYRVVSRSGERLNLQPGRASLPVPDLRVVKVTPGVAGCKADVAPGSMVLVSFINGDPTRPAVTSFDDPDSPGFAPDRLDLVGKDDTLVSIPNAHGRVVRYGDPIVFGNPGPGTVEISVPSSLSRVRA